MQHGLGSSQNVLTALWVQSEYSRCYARRTVLLPCAQVTEYKSKESFLNTQKTSAYMSAVRAASAGPSVRRGMDVRGPGMRPCRPTCRSITRI